MKKFLLLVFALFLCACKGKEYEVTYVVYYPNHAKTYTMVVEGVPYIDCHRGVNYIRTGHRRYFESIAPMEIISYKEVKTE